MEVLSARFFPLTTLNIDFAKVLVDGNLLIFRPRDFRRRNANTRGIAMLRRRQTATIIIAMITISR